MTQSISVRTSMYSSHRRETSGSSRQPTPEFDREGARTLVERLASSEGVESLPRASGSRSIFLVRSSPTGRSWRFSPPTSLPTSLWRHTAQRCPVRCRAGRSTPPPAGRPDRQRRSGRNPEAVHSGELDGSNPFRATGTVPHSDVMMDFAAHSHDGFIIVEAEPTTISLLPLFRAPWSGCATPRRWPNWGS